MATYVMSDLHGAYNPLLNMLEEINFCDEDTLYILGDVVDRGPDGIKIIQYIMGKENIKMILGNHEHMFIQYFEPDSTELIKRRWNRNGNITTLKGLDAISEEERKEVLDFLKALPDEQKVTINGITYILVHGFLGEDTFQKVWNRPKIDEKADIKENERIIIGHTPVCEYVCPGTDESMYVYSHNLTEKGEHFNILHAAGFTNVDCCIGYGFSAARLACLRLEDGAEFYVKVDK